MDLSDKDELVDDGYIKTHARRCDSIVCPCFIAGQTELLDSMEHEVKSHKAERRDWLARLKRSKK